MTPNLPFSDVPTAIEEIRVGHMVVVVDDEDRENEGDLTIAAEKITPEVINFMAKFGRGLVCLAMTEERLDHLRIGPMTAENTSNYGTAFCEAIDARDAGRSGALPHSSHSPADGECGRRSEWRCCPLGPKTDYLAHAHEKDGYRPAKNGVGHN